MIKVPQAIFPLYYLGYGLKPFEKRTARGFKIFQKISQEVTSPYIQQCQGSKAAIHSSIRGACPQNFVTREARYALYVGRGR